MNTETDYVTSVMDSVKPLIHAQDFKAVCQKIGPAIDAALEQGLGSEAASLSAILASFLSICGDEQAALGALQRAEDLAPAELRHAFGTAGHLFSLGRKEEAFEKARSVASRTDLDLITRHKALAMMGVFAASEGRLDEASALLGAAHDMAHAGIETIWWNLELPKLLMERGTSLDAIRFYLNDLTARAAAEGEERVLQKAKRLLAALS